MSDTDSFIEEVSEEVRRERLYGYLKRYGWIGVVLVLGLVGGAAYNEWRKAQAQSAAQAAGDTLIAALELEDNAERLAALQAIDTSGSEAPIVALLTASEQERDGDFAGAVATLDALAADGSVQADYRDLAAIKSLMLSDGIADAQTRRAGFETLAAPGETYRLIALEQLVFLDMSEGNSDAAMTGLVSIVEDAEVTAGLRERAIGLIVALGGDIDPAWSDQDQSQ